MHHFWQIQSFLLLVMPWIFLLIIWIWQRQYQCRIAENRIAQMSKWSLWYDINILDQLLHYLTLCFKRMCLQLGLFCSTHGNALHSDCLPVVLHAFSRLFFTFRKFALFHVRPPSNILTTLQQDSHAEDTIYTQNLSSGKV